MLKLVSGLAAIAAVLLMDGAALAASGTAVGVNPDAEAEGKETRTLVVGADIFIGERVITGPSGQVQILFSDNTKLVVGPRSALLIEDYLLREDGSAGKFAVNALSGTFRFVTGGARKDSYVITTPTGTIGVRGTAFELYVAGLWSYVLMQHGSTVLRPFNGDEMVLEGACEFGIIGSDGAEVVGNTDDVKGADREKLKEIFLYVMSQSSLMSKFRIANAERCLRRPVDTQGGSSISDPSTGNVPQATPTPQPNPPCTYCNNSVGGNRIN
jgi:hypothetical protein